MITFRAPRPARGVRRWLALLVVGACLTACERVQIDPSVAEGPLPSPGDPVDTLLAYAGKSLFERSCLACHRMQGPELVGPNLGDVASRRGFDWIRGMVLSPDSMLRVDAPAKALLDRYKVPMTDTGLDEVRFRAVLEYLRLSAGQGAGGDPAARPSPSPQMPDP